MKTIEQLRLQHWSGRNTLWPRTQVSCQMPFIWKGMEVNKPALQLAQASASEALRTGDVRNWNRGNFLLTAAYMGGSENEAFWGQFI